MRVTRSTRELFHQIVNLLLIVALGGGTPLAAYADPPPDPCVQDCVDDFNDDAQECLDDFKAAIDQCYDDAVAAMINCALDNEDGAQQCLNDYNSALNQCTTTFENRMAAATSALDAALIRCAFTPNPPVCVAAAFGAWAAAMTVILADYNACEQNAKTAYENCLANLQIDTNACVEDVNNDLHSCLEDAVEDYQNCIQAAMDAYEDCVADCYWS